MIKTPTSIDGDDDGIGLVDANGKFVFGWKDVNAKYRHQLEEISYWLNQRPEVEAVLRDLEAWWEGRHSENGTDMLARFCKVLRAALAEPRKETACQ